MGNSVHCLILHTTKNNIDMSRSGRCIELPSSIVPLYVVISRFFFYNADYFDQPCCPSIYNTPFILQVKNSKLNSGLMKYTGR